MISLNLLLLNNFHPVMSHRRAERENDELLYTVWSLVTVRSQLPASKWLNISFNKERKKKAESKDRGISRREEETQKDENVEAFERVHVFALLMACQTSFTSCSNEQRLSIDLA